jgi:PAS domain S-box-containing protein
VLLRADGQRIPILKTVTTIIRRGRKYLIESFVDITERKRAEEALKNSERKYREFADSLPEIAFEVDEKGNVTFFNRTAFEILGYSQEDFRSMSIFRFLIPEDRVRVKENIQKILKGEKSRGNEYTLLRKDGSTFPALAFTNRIVSEDGKGGLRGVIIDISEQKNTEKKLRESEEKLARAREMMNEKLRVVGGLTRHDVRNKLSTITGNIFLNKKRLAGHPETLESFSDMESACEQIVRIFDFAKDYELLGAEELRYVDVEKIVDEAVSLFPNLQGVKISNGCHGLTVLADSLLRQLFYNLIDNSLKYGEKLSQIRIHFEKTEGDQFRLVYEDNGVGIASNAKQKIFDEGHTTGKGSGYGLYLVKRMMEVYGWIIEETGEPDKGAQFTITIPKTDQNGKENYRIA